MPGGRRPVRFGDQFVDTPVHDRALLNSGAKIVGPAIVEEVESTFVMPPGFALSVDRARNLIVTQVP